MFEGLRATLGLFDRVTSDYEYWEGYRGEEVWIRSHRLERPPPDSLQFEQGAHQQDTYVIKGTVEEVLSVPPGFVLADVQELIIRSDFSLLFGIDSKEAQEIVEGPRAQEVIREIEKKFVSFDSIDQLERLDWVESSREPYRAGGGVRPREVEAEASEGDLG